MGWKFNPFTGQFDYYQTATSGDSSIDGGSPSTVYTADQVVDGGDVNGD